MCLCVCASVRLCACASVRLCVCASVCLCAYVPVCLCVCVLTCLLVSVLVCSCVCLSTATHTQTHTHTNHTPTPTHTHTHPPIPTHPHPLTGRSVHSPRRTLSWHPCPSLRSPSGSVNVTLPSSPETRRLIRLARAERRNIIGISGSPDRVCCAIYASSCRIGVKGFDTPHHIWQLAQTLDKAKEFERDFPCPKKNGA